MRGAIMRLYFLPIQEILVSDPTLLTEEAFFVLLSTMLPQLRLLKIPSLTKRAFEVQILHMSFESDSFTLCGPIRQVQSMLAGEDLLSGETEVTESLPVNSFDMSLKV